ncbi:MAG: nucleotidyltransferase domain-containing protein [Spirochaetales bacterium]|nr:nucleotidyltransferase domain-containing protein [Spirochaetales bacterium]
MVTEEIKMLAERIRDSVHPDKIYLFGSFARNEERADSDYDFYIVVPDNTPDRSIVSQQAYLSLRGLKRRPVDIVVGSESGFAERKKCQTIEQTIATEGVLLYAK